MPVPHATKVKSLTVHPRGFCTLSMDFITGLPLSQGNITIIVIVDRFSKAARFIPLSKLPTAKEVLNHVFRVFGILQDIEGPNFPPDSGRHFANLWVIWVLW